MVQRSVQSNALMPCRPWIGAGGTVQADLDGGVDGGADDHPLSRLRTLRAPGLLGPAEAASQTDFPSPGRMQVCRPERGDLRTEEAG